MKALILVGGYGTRLRPLTLTLPKPLVEFGNKHMILHQIEALVEAGVTEIILAVNYRADIMESALRQFEKKYNIKITLSVETEPLGTAGPLALAREHLIKDHSPFFVLNSDIICDFPFTDMIAFHKSHGREGTLMVTKVNEPSKYGVIVCQPDSNQIEKFVEKPQVFVSNRINAGLYLFNPSILDRIEVKPTSIEKEIFPRMAEEGQLQAMDLIGYWMDIGQPRDFLTGLGLYLQSLALRTPDALAKDSFVVGHVLIDPTAKIGRGCKIGPNVVIGPHVVIEDGVRLSKTCIMAGAQIQTNAWINNTIVGWNCRVGRWSRLEGVTVLGENVTIADELYINGVQALPHKTISETIAAPQIVM